MIFRDRFSSLLSKKHLNYHLSEVDVYQKKDQTEFLAPFRLEILCKLFSLSSGAQPLRNTFLRKLTLSFSFFVLLYLLLLFAFLLLWISTFPVSPSLIVPKDKMKIQTPFLKLLSLQSVLRFLGLSILSLTPLLSISYLFFTLVFRSQPLYSLFLPNFLFLTIQ